MKNDEKFLLTIQNPEKYQREEEEEFVLIEMALKNYT